MDINRLRAVVFRDIVSRGIPSFLLADMYFLPAPKYGEYKHVVIQIGPEVTEGQENSVLASEFRIVEYWKRFSVSVGLVYQRGVAESNDACYAGNTVHALDTFLKSKAF